jgi:ABC-type multidrug transport system permease subunit
MSRGLPIVRAFIRRDFAIALSYRVPFAFDLISVLVQATMFFYVGKLIEPGAGGSEDLERGYFAFVLVGLTVFGVARAGIMAFSDGIREAQLTGNLEMLLTRPAPVGAIVVGAGAYETLRALMTGALILLVGLLLFGVDYVAEPWPLLAALLSYLAVAAFFAAIGCAIASFTLLYMQGKAMVGLVVLAMSLLSGLYYPVDVLPDVLQTLGQALPTTWALDLMRACLIRGEVDEPLLAALAAASAAGLPLSVWLFSRALDRARRAGSLGQY